ncbi:MAG: ActD protein [Myxococcota bacterium]
MSRNIPDRLVERVFLGEATSAERDAVTNDADAAARLAAIPADNQAFFDANPIDDTIRRIEGKARAATARAESANAAPNRWVGMLLGPVLAVGMAGLWVTIAADEPAESPLEVNTPKGLAPKLRVYRQRSEGFERLPAGAVARKGDRLQVGVVSGDAQHGVVVSIDGRGAVTLHWPPSDAADTELRPGEQRMPNAYELDDAPEYERFFLVTTGESPTDVSTVVHAAEALAASGAAKVEPLAVPQTYEQSSFIVRKEPRAGGAQ